MTLIGGTSAILFACIRKNHYSLERMDILFSSFYAGIGALIGAKILYILVSLSDIIENWEIYTSSIDAFFTIIKGGFIFYGGLIGALIGILIYAKQYKINVLHLVETLVPSIPLFHGFGRIGCFCAGCCYGKPTTSSLGMQFNCSPIAPHNIYLLPVQLFESGFNFLLFIFLFVLSRKKRRYGIILGFYLLFYSIARFILEFYRYDYVRGIWGGLSTSQWISIFLLFISLILLFNKKAIKFLENKC